MGENTCPGPLRKVLLKSDRESNKGVVSPGEGWHLLRGWSEEAMPMKPHLSTDLKNC